MVSEGSESRFHAPLRVSSTRKRTSSTRRRTSSTRKRAVSPYSGNHVLRASGRVLGPPAAQSPHMGSVKTNAKIGVAPRAFNIAPDAMFLPSTLKRIFELPPHPPFNVESKTGKRAPAPRITNSTLNGGRGGRQPVLLYITFSNAKKM